MRRLVLLLGMPLLAACNWTVEPLPANAPMGFVPVYAVPDSVNKIASTAARPTNKPGKIYAYTNYLFQVEEATGIHIIDNAVPKAAKKIAFLRVPLASELAIKDGYLYTNNVNDLVVFNLSNPAAPALVKRVPDAFPAISQKHPPFTNVFFECPDPAKGVVVGWEQKQIANLKCRR